MAPDTNPSSGPAAAAQFQVDEAYEFRAPKYFDFVNDETENEVRAAERWFEAYDSHAPSPFAPRIKESRTGVKIDSLCDVADAETAPKEEAAGGFANHAENVDGNAQEKKDSSFAFVPEVNPGGNCANDGNQQHEESAAACPDAMSESPPAEEEEKESPKSFEFPPSKNSAAKSADDGSSTPKIQKPPPPVKVVTAVPTCAKLIVKTESCTPKVPANASKGGLAAVTGSNIVQLSSLKQSSMSAKRSLIKGAPDVVAAKAATAANDIAQQNQAVKRQKLDDGRTRQILNVKTRVLPHKGRGGLAGSTEMTLSSMRKHHDDVHSMKEVTPYVSAAEMVKKFESGTRELGIPHNGSLSHEDAATALQRRPKLMLTRPKEPELQTAHRIRAVRAKSSAELEEEMLAKIPKFRARPFNKKSQSSKPLKLTEPKPPQLETVIRARPPRVKSSQELELEELEKAPQVQGQANEQKDS